jgi:aspartate-semialdehyde dehydrogenase
MLKVLEERGFPVSELYPVASGQSVGKSILFNGEHYKVVSMEDAIAARPILPFFQPVEMFQKNLLLASPKWELS